MRTSEKCGAIMAALAKVQAAIPSIAKNKGVKVEGEKAQWSSRYATLDALDEATRPHVYEHGIAIVQGCRFEQGAGLLHVTRLALGEEWIEVTFPLKPSRDGAQGLGGAITFARRWGLCAALNLIPDDAEEAQGYKDAKAETRAPRRAAAPAGLPDHLAAIRDAESLLSFEAAARAARSKHPAGEASNAVEHAISDKLVAVLDGLVEGQIDKLTGIKDMWPKLAPRGGEARQALQRARARVEPRS